MSFNFIRLVSIASTAVALVACGSDVDEPGLPGDLAAELAAQPSYQFAAEGARISAQAAALRVDRSAEVAFSVLAGDLVLAADESSVTVVDFTVDVGDVEVPADIVPPSGLALTQIQIELAGAATGGATWSAGGDRLEAQLEVDLLLHWAVRRDDRDIPLGDITVSAVPLELTVVRSAGETSVSIRADRGGAFWSWANTFELRDLELALDAI